MTTVGDRASGDQTSAATASTGGRATALNIANFGNFSIEFNLGGKPHAAGGAAAEGQPAVKGLTLLPLVIAVGSAMVLSGAYLTLPNPADAGYFSVKELQLLLLGFGSGMCVGVLVPGFFIVARNRDGFEEFLIASLFVTLLALGIANFTPAATDAIRIFAPLTAGLSLFAVLKRLVGR